jgi:hypothetical protein
MIRFIQLILLMTLTIQVTFAQYVEEEDDMQLEQTDDSNKNQNKFVYGGNALIGFGNPSVLMFTPRLGYRLRDPLIVGASFTYLSYRENVRLGNQISSLNLQSFGPGLFSMYFFNLPLVDELGFQGFTALEYDFWRSTQRIDHSTSTFNFQQLLIGGGVISNAGRLVTTVGIYYDLLYYRNQEVFASPVSYRIGVLF